MDAFDPELYLRLLGEREHASSGDLQHARLNGFAPLLPAASALVATGVIDAELAGAIVADYDLAATVNRGGDPRGHPGRLPCRSASAVRPASLVPRRIVALNGRIPLPDADLHPHALIIDAGGDGRLECEYISRRPFGHGRSATGPASLTFTTPQFTRPAHFAGGWGGDNVAEGSYAIGPIDPRTEWIDIEGTRLALTDDIDPPQVRIESRETPSRALRYLWQGLADPSARMHNRSGATEFAISALIAAGVLAAGDAELEGVRWVAEYDGLHHRHPARRGWPGSVPMTPPDAVPEPWRSLLGRSPAGDGPSGTLAVGAGITTLDGVSAVINTLTSTADAMTLGVEMSGNAPAGHPGEDRPVGVVAPAWWAVDDRGHTYLGQTGRWSSDEVRSHGDITFGPLHPRAAVLTVALNTLDARAVIAIPLNWSRDATASVQPTDPESGP